MPSYNIQTQDELEELSITASPDEQSQALNIVSRVLETNGIAYGVIGGMNFYLRGSGRTTLDVDIAVDNPPRMDSLLQIFNNDQRIYRPANRMQWASGIARLFVQVNQAWVQVDLKPKGAEGHLIPRDISSSVDDIQFQAGGRTLRCKALSIGPLVAAKIKAHYGRETEDDFIDLLFVCKSREFGPKVRMAADSFREEWKECFLNKVKENNAADEVIIRWALKMDNSASASASTSTASSSFRAKNPRDGDRSEDEYWTYSSRHQDWYHKHRDGRYTWAGGSR